MNKSTHKAHRLSAQQREPGKAYPISYSLYQEQHDHMAWRGAVYHRGNASAALRDLVQLDRQLNLLGKEYARRQKLLQPPPQEEPDDAAH